MTSKLAKLAERRAALAAMAERQRLELGRAVEPLRRPLGIADHGLSALRFVARHKTLAAGVLALVVAMRPQPALGWLHKAWRAGRMVLMVTRILGR